MPLIKIQSSVNTPEKVTVDNLLKSLSAKLAKHLNKPESYVMTAFESDIPMTFGGTLEPVCYVEIKSIGKMKPEQTKAMSADFCQQIESELGVPANRIYLEFADSERHLWGWNKGTF
jgi:phenylpyruvate tautomerase